MRTSAAVVFVVFGWLGWQPGPPQDPTRDAAMLQRALQLAAPAEQHDRLGRLCGEWQVALVTTPPGGKEQADRGRVVVRPILGGRYVVANFTLQLGGGNVEAVQILGFDTLRQLYTASWRDDRSTWSVEATGSPSATAPDVLVLRGSLADARDPTGRPFRLEIDLGSSQRVQVRVHDTHDGTEFLLQTQQWTKG